jgi:hypothetical protein
MKVFFRKIKAQSAIEVLLSGILFVMLSGGVISALLYSRNATMLATQRSQAVIFAEEGMTALRSMRDRDFGLLTNGTDKALVYNDGKWEFVGVINADSDSKDGMTRRVDIADGPIAGQTKLVTVKVLYFLGPNRSNTYEIKSVLADLYDNTGAEGASSGPLQYGGNYASSGNFKLADQDFGDYTGEAGLAFGAGLPSITVASLNPLDNATGVSVSSNLVMTFSGNAVVGSGNITVQKTSDDSVVKTIAVGDAQVTGGGTTTITINPTTDLPVGTGLYVLVPSTAFVGFAGISDKNTWNFTTTSQGCINLAGYASNPIYDQENGTTGKIGPTLAVTPPTGMVSGDVVVMFAHYRGTVTLEMSETGGQAWSALTQTQYSTTSTSRIFYATYNGTWSADPSVTVTTGTESMVVGMYVFRGVDGSNPLDVVQSTAGYAATTNVTRSGITTNTGGAMVLAFWSSVDDNSWDLMTRSQTDGVSGWRGLTTVSNQGGTDNSISVAYKIMPTAGASGDVTNRQTRNGGDAGATHIIALKPL